MKHDSQLETILQAFHSLLDAMKVEDRLSLAGIPSARAHASGSSRGEAPEPEHVVAAEPYENFEAEPKMSTTLSSLFPATAEGWELLASHLAEYGSGKLAAATLGVRPETFSRHHNKVRRAQLPPEITGVAATVVVG